MKHDDSIMKFKAPTIWSAAKFFINGEQVCEIGKIGTDREKSEYGGNRSLFPFTGMGEEREIIIQVSNFSLFKSGIVRGGLILGEETALIVARESQLFKDIFLFGAIMIIALYHFVLFFLRREEMSPLYFAFLCAFVGMFTTVTGEYMLLIMIPGFSGSEIQKVLNLAYFTSIPLFSMFVHSLFPEEYSKKFTRITMVIGFSMVAITLFTPMHIYLSLRYFYQTFTLCIIIYFGIAIVRAIKNRREGSLLLASASLIIFVAIINDILYASTIISTFYASPLGLLFFIVFQSILIAKKFSQAFFMKDRLAADLNDLNINLEKKVEERTTELQDANQEMREINVNLHETRDALWGEMQLAKKIQTILLPTKPSIDKYEITGYMNPADEVGGDYYDVINGGEVDWLIIGDVSGHGLPAGLVMMMVQTSIQTILRDNPGINPSTLLGVINRAISYNVEKLNEDKYMTITALGIHDNGRIVFSGLHQDIFIYRASSGTVESIETDGLWLGILYDLGRINEDNEFNLYPGDSLLLYTDGITESRHISTKNKNKLDMIKDMYGESQLMDVLKECGNESTDTIKNKILESMKDYYTDDDVTMLVVKRIS